MNKNIPSPLEFFGHLCWIDGRPLLDTRAEAWAREREAIAARNSSGLSRPASGLSYYTGGNFGSWIRGG